MYALIHLLTYVSILSRKFFLFLYVVKSVVGTYFQFYHFDRYESEKKGLSSNNFEIVFYFYSDKPYFSLYRTFHCFQLVIVTAVIGFRRDKAK